MGLTFSKPIKCLKFSYIQLFYWVIKYCRINTNRLGKFIINIFIIFFRKHIEVHGRPTPAVFRSEPEAGGQSSYELTWTVDSYSPIIEYRLLYRQIQPYHKVRYKLLPKIVFNNQVVVFY